MAIAAFAAALLAATAFAAPKHNGTVSSAAPTFAWEGGPGNGSGQGVAAMRCQPAVYECEDTLIEVKNPGDLFAEVKGGDGANDLDVAIYKSDAQGTTDSPPNADNPDVEDVSTGKDSKTTLKKVTPGFYVVRVRIFDGIQAKWTGAATLKGAAATPAPTTPNTAPSTPPSTQPAPTTQPAPQSQPPAKTKPAAKERRNACKKKAKKIKNKRKRAKAMKRCKKIR